MLSKVLATLVATMAVAFAGYTLCDHSSRCCSGSLPTATPVSSESCCEVAMPSCCSDTPAVTTEAACTEVCPAAKAAAEAKALTTTEAPK